MNLTVRTLRIDDSVTVTTETAVTHTDSAVNALVEIGSRLRDRDPTVAACRANEITIPGEIPRHTWTGHYTKEHMEVIARREREGRANW